jgi:hypothetical protein
MEDRFAGCNQVVSYDSPMTTPPYRLRAHNCRWRVMSKIKQPPKARSKIVAHRVIRVVVEILILPKGIDPRRNIAPRSSQSTESRDVLITDLKLR